MFPVGQRQAFTGQQRALDWRTTIMALSFGDGIFRLTGFLCLPGQLASVFKALHSHSRFRRRFRERPCWIVVIQAARFVCKEFHHCAAVMQWISPLAKVICCLSQRCFTAHDRPFTPQNHYSCGQKPTTDFIHRVPIWLVVVKPPMGFQIKAKSNVFLVRITLWTGLI